MDVAEAYRHVTNSSPTAPGTFYGAGKDLALGKGCIYRGAPFPLFDPDAKRYRTVAGPVFVLTHECDVDPDNRRLFNDAVLICPLIPLERMAEEVSGLLPDEQQRGFFSNLGARNISRLTYLPPIPGLFNYGSVMYMNVITNCDVVFFKDSAKFECAVSGVGLRDIEYALENHMLRPKAERLTFTPLQPPVCPLPGQVGR